MISVSGPLAFAAGLASFLSPCVLPLVPAYLAYMAGGEKVAQARRIGGALAFSAGLGLILVLGFYVLRIAFADVRGFVVPIAGIALLVLAAHTAGLLRLQVLNLSWQPVQAPAAAGPAGGFVLGLGLGIGWTPCIGPTLGAVLTAGAVEGTTAQGLALLLAYWVGLALPFVLLAMGVVETRALISALRRHQRALDLAAAAILAAMGLLLLTGQFALLNRAFSTILPAPLQTPFGL